MECSIEGCNKKAVSRTWCTKHYRRWFTHGDPLITKTKRVDHIGKRFGYLTVTSLHSTGRKVRWNVICDCGETSVAVAEKLVSGLLKSCGCRTGVAKQEKCLGRVRYIYERNAKERGIDFLLSDKDLEFLIFQDCFYCGETPSNKVKGLVYNGIDRVNNGKPYEVLNCVPCCRLCNVMKKAMSFEDFLDHIKKISEKHFKKESDNDESKRTSSV